MKFSSLGPAPVPAYQNLDEFGRFWDFLASTKPKRILEIGSLFGGTLWYWMQLPSLSTVFTIDLPTDYEPLRDDVREARLSWGKWADMNAIHFQDFPRSSQDDRILQEVNYAAAGLKFDFIFIDGDHTYQGVKDDFDRWGLMLKSNGIVAFHDTVPTPERHEPGVVKFVEELKFRYPSLQFFTPPDGAGITAFIVP